MSAMHAWPDEDSAEVGKALGYVQRKTHRVNNPTLCVQLRGKPYQTLNWSLDGFLIGGYNGALAPGDLFEIDMIGLAGRQSWPVMIEGRVIRTGGKTGMEMAAQFVTLSAPAYDFLEGVLLRRPEYRAA